MTAEDLTSPGDSRRAFLRWGALAAVAAPILTEAELAWGAQPRPNTALGPDGGVKQAPPPGAVLINANENPLGPSPAACQAIAAIAPLGGRYDLRGETEALTRTFAAQHGLPLDHVAVYAGSSEPLHYTVMAFTSPEQGFVTADPSYEAGMVAALSSGAPIRKVPLTPAYAHDVKAMLAADPKAGVFYVCNPNNPTGTLTPREDILYLLENKPKGSILLVDEAYIHLSDAPDVLDQVAAGKDLIVLRTFSKIYGMAGIRCGFAVGRPDLLARLKPYGQNAMPVTASAAARVSLEDPALVPARKAIIGNTRRDTLQWLTANGYKPLGASQSNCFMIDTGREAHGVIAAMRGEGVWIGRSWPIWPNAVRVSVGTPEEMARFKIAWTRVMSRPATAARAAPATLAGLAFPHLS